MISKSFIKTDSGSPVYDSKLVPLIVTLVPGTPVEGDTYMTGAASTGKAGTSSARVKTMKKMRNANGNEQPWHQNFPRYAAWWFHLITNLNLQLPHPGVSGEGHR